MAAKVETNQKYENKEASQKGGKQIGAGAVGGIIIVVTFVVLLAIGVYYVKVTRQSNMNRTINNVQSHA
jgi:predicted metalloprotease